MWNEKGVHGLDTGYNMWPWPLTSLMTLTLDVSGPVDMEWKGCESSIHDHDID